MATDPTTLLASVEADIERVVKYGQSVRTPDGTLVTRSNLEVLIALRDKLKGEVNPAASNQAVKLLTVVPGRLR